jgi:hypothetical protein
MKKMCSFGLGKGKDATLGILVVLGLLAVSGYADLSRSSDLILDARHENVVWFANTENCVERSVSSGVSLSSVWSGDLTFLRIEKKVITPYNLLQEVLTPKKCENETGNGDDVLSCFDVTYVNVTKYRTDWLPFDSDAKSDDLSSIASGLEQKTRDVLSTAKSSGKSDKEETIRVCFRTPGKAGQAHISYIALSDSKYASDESTDVNITSQSLIWQSPTLVNASVIIHNYNEMNLSIGTDHLDTFKFNWNGTNYSVYDNSLVLALNYNNNSAIGETSSTAVDISKNNDMITLTNAAFIPATHGSALQFNQVSTYGYTASTNWGTNLLGDYTVEFWGKFPVNFCSINYCTVIGYVSGSGSGWADIGVAIDVYEGGQLILQQSNNGGSGLSHFTSISVNDGVMRHYAITRSGNTYTWYLNGSQDTQTTSSLSTKVASWPIRFGVGYPPTGYLNGSIDDVRIYNRALSAQEVWTQYQSDFQKYNPTEFLFYGNITGLSQGTYTYHGWANDTSGNNAYSETRTLTYDSSYPAVQLVTLDNAVWTASSWVNFVYNVSQNLSGIDYCNLTVNDGVLNSSSSIAKDTDQTLYANLVNGVYNWSVNCTGQNGLMNWSTTYNMSVATTTTTTTTTTTMASFCSLGLDCDSCTGWAYINATSGTLQALDADSNGKYDRVCCGGIVSNYTAL